MEFPQLDSGLIVQVPVSLRIQKRMDVNRFRDGSVIKNTNSSQSQYTWNCKYVNLSDHELLRFEEFWHSTGRGAATFTFVDPLGNMLRDTENVLASSWTKSGTTEITEAASTGQYKEYLLTNSGTIASVVSQVIDVSPQFSVLFSCLAKWVSTTAISLVSSDDSGSIRKSFTISGESYCGLKIAGGLQSAVRTFGIEVPPQSQVIVSELQVEIALGRGTYVPSAAGGVFHKAWIEPYDFTIKTEAPGAHSINLIVHCER